MLEIFVEYKSLIFPKFVETHENVRENRDRQNESSRPYRFAGTRLAIAATK